MKCEYKLYDPDKACVNLTKSKEGKLLWDGKQDALIVQTPYGENPADYSERLCSLLEKLGELPEDYTRLEEGIYARHVPYVQGQAFKGCPMNGLCCSYTVFSCSLEGDTLTLYAPIENAMLSPRLDAALEIHVDITRDTEERGLIKKHPVPTGYYRMSLPCDMAESYIDGSMSYTAGNITIPITKKMLAVGTVFIRSEEKPQPVSSLKGLKLV